MENVLEELLKYQGLTEGPIRFRKVSKAAVAEAEEEIGAKFPDQLRSFYVNVGYGWITSHEAEEELLNLIIHPLDVADLFLGRSPFRPDFSFLPGDLPFFDAGWSRFLVLRPGSENPNRVYRDDGLQVRNCRDFFDFLHQLLVHPHFYLDQDAWDGEREH